MATYKELQAQCKDAGLPATGKKADLLKRLKVHRKEQRKDKGLPPVGRPLAPRFVFVGDAGKGATSPATITTWGKTFALNGEPVPVVDEFLQAKLRGNSHFKEV